MVMVELGDIPEGEFMYPGKGEGPARMGRVSTEWTAWCGTCENWEQSEVMDCNKSAFITRLRRVGWKRKRDTGWTCPDCVADVPVLD